MHFLLERYLLKKLFKGELCDLTSNLMLPLMLQHVNALLLGQAISIVLWG